MSIRVRTRQIAVLAAGLACAASAHANLIVNGGFEAPDVPTGNWAYYSSASVPGWQGDNIEIWDNLNGVVAVEGKQHAELNAHPGTAGSAFSIFQTFATAVGHTYDVSFFYRARENGNEAFRFSAGPLSALIDDHVVGAWSQYSGSFVADSLLTTLRFTTVSTGTLGNFLDDVVVTERQKVPESGTLALLGLGLAGLGLARRRALPDAGSVSGQFTGQTAAVRPAVRELPEYLRDSPASDPWHANCHRSESSSA